MTNLPPPPPPPPAPPPAQPPWYRTTSGAIGIGVVAVLVGVVVYLVMNRDDGGVASGTTSSSSSSTVATTLASTSTLAPTTSVAASTSTSTTVLATTSTTAAPITTTTSTTAPLVLNFSLPANFGEYSLASGFLPDPAEYDATSGGLVDASYLGGGCYGFASPSPDLKINYTAGAYPTLRFYFVSDTAGADTVLIINTPGGSYLCNDDSWGTFDPTLDFNSPAGGRYDIWIASVTPGASHTGTLYVTENMDNHP